MISGLATGLLAVSWLILPGWLLARRWRLPLPALAGFIVGAMSLLLLLQTLNAFHLPLNRPTLLSAWSLFTALALIANRRSRRLEPIDPGTVESKPASAPWFIWLPLLPPLAVFAYRAIAQPLYGADTIFRWDFLARQMFQHQSLAFYPPVTASDYTVYGWADGIPPLVSSLYCWSYTLAATTKPILTAPLVIAQFILLIAGVIAAAKRDFSARAGIFAGILLASTPVVLWATGMGQETGLTALGAVGLLLYLPRSRGEESYALISAAALSAALAASAREYGLVFIPLGVVLGWNRGLSRGALLKLALIGLAAVAPWYVRNWILTGNPLFNQSLGGLFPINEQHHRLMQLYEDEFSWTHLPADAPWVIATNCLAALVGGTIGAGLYFRRFWSLTVAAMVVFSLAAISVSFTAAGYFYALRVLNPALVFGAFLGGAALARGVPGRRHLVGVIVALTLLASDAALRALVLPGNPYKIPASDWLAAGNSIHAYHQQPQFGQVAELTKDKRVLVLGPHALMVLQGSRVVPPWSPEVAYLFDLKRTPEEIAQRLTVSEIGYVLLNRGEFSRRYLSASPLFREPGRIFSGVVITDDLALFKITAGLHAE